MKLTIDDIAHTLNLSVNTIERWARQGKIPIQKNGAERYIQHSVLEKWAAAHNLKISPHAASINRSSKIPATSPDSLLSAMECGGIFYRITGNEINTVYKGVVDVIQLLSLHAKDNLYQKLIEREHISSTGIGKGVAVPHPRSPLSELKEYTIITTCFLEHPIEFGAVDRLPVFVLFVILCPSSKLHLDLLSRLAFCIQNNSFVELLRTNPSSDVLFTKVAELENQYQHY